MARSVYTYIKDPQGNIVWSSTELDGVNCEHEDTDFCGRNEETGIIALYANNEAGEIDITSRESFNHIRRELEWKQVASNKYYERFLDRIEALRECRAKASSLAIFLEFEAELCNTYERVEDEYWNRAGDMIQLMEHTRQKAAELVTAKRGCYTCDDFIGYTIYWRNDE